MQGLPNLGNTCYVNTTLQCLWACESFREYMKKNDVFFNIPNVFEVCDRSQRIRSYKEMILQMSRSISIIDFREQMDIHEFVLFYLDFFFETFKKIVRVQKPKMLITTNSKISYNLDAHWFNSYSEVCDLIYGQYLIETKCQRCKHCVYNYETSSVLSLAIPSLETSLNECITEYFSETEVERVCDKCKHSTSMRETFMCKSPKVLICCLKRFQFSDNCFSKQVTPISIPQELIVSDFVKHNTLSPSYKLKSIAMHHGSLNDGHYTAVIVENEKCVHINDFDVCDVSLSQISDEIVSNNYMIFYERFN